eukprot:ANDGO_00840.mRNA.1 hypothetical protein DICPUDRAFT_153563
MRIFLVFFALCVLFARGHCFFWNWGSNAGVPVFSSGPSASNCAACTIIVSIIEKMSVIHEKTVDDVLANVCDLFPATLQPPCKSAVATYGPFIIQALAANIGPDETCRKMKLCDAWPTCQLFPKPSSTKSASQEAAFTVDKELADKMHAAGVSPWEWIVDQIRRAVATHEPLVDEDGDKFAYWDGTLRGYSWRGKDCEDRDGSVYPGRADGTGHPHSVDYNCNGVKGANIRGESYEDLLCKGTDPRGVILLSDSQGAHFRIPGNWMNASAIGAGTYDHILFALENELDWPHLGAYTGHRSDDTGDVPGPVDSVYMRLYDRNHCNKGNAQNLGVNGARIADVAGQLKTTMHINKTADYPALVFISLVGNDVCRSHDGLVEHMTQPDEFESDLLTALQWLDTQLPANSWVTFVGLVDGRILWNQMHARTHPIGVEYQTVYEYLSCLHISPCQGWMTPNETMRNATSAQAALLSSVYEKVMSEHSFLNFKMSYIDYDVAAIEQVIIQRGGQPWELIEETDGFHPSQIANALFAEYFWNLIVKDHPEALGGANPNNAAIEALFGKDPSWE